MQVNPRVKHEVRGVAGASWPGNVLRKRRAPPLQAAFDAQIEIFPHFPCHGPANRSKTHRMPEFRVLIPGSAVGFQTPDQPIRMNRRFFGPLFSVIALGGLLVTASAKVPGYTRELLSQMPMVFESAGDHFAARGEGYQLSLTPGGAMLSLAPPKKNSCCGAADGQPAKPAVLRLKLAGAKQNPSMAGLAREESPAARCRPHGCLTCQ